MAQALTKQSSSWRPKRTVLLVAALSSTVFGFLIVLPNETGPALLVIRLAFVICDSLLVLAWCYYDSFEQHQSLLSLATNRHTNFRSIRAFHLLV